MAQIAFYLHPAQEEINNHPARFKIVVAGRRFGKTVFSVIRCFIEALRTTNRYGDPLDSSSEVIYVGIDREQARRNAWPYVLQFVAEIEKATGLKVRVLEKTSMVELPKELGGGRIRLMGMDDPDAARGMKLRFAVLDEYADMPSRVWPEIIRPALMDVRGEALFIGTPKGRNHFFELVQKAVEDTVEREEQDKEPLWAVFNYSSNDNTLLNTEELSDMVKEYTNGSEDLYEQEIAASFISQSGQLFNRSDFQIIDELPNDSYYETYIAVDLAGFEQDPDRKKQVRRLDDSAIAVVAVNAKGQWFVLNILYGKWDVQETARRIVATANVHKVQTVGIEKGALANAVEPYMRDYMTRFNRWFEIKPLTHGNQRKYDRIQWALQGRVSNRNVFLLKGPWNEKFIDQAVSFPDRNVHDDLVDALAYVDQMAEEVVRGDWSQEIMATMHVPIDDKAGY